MSGLNGTIVFKSAEYRPCTAKGRPALFHKWEENSDIYAPSLMVGGRAGGVVKYTRAIVEYEDGHVERVQPEDVIFVDNYFREFAFPENQSEAPTNPPKKTSPLYTDRRINCPHCGGDNKNAVVCYGVVEKEYFTYCQTCGIETVETYKTEARAIRAFSEGKTKSIIEGSGNE